ncbi:MAG: DUF692 domain-containing protein [Candidatus Puniceispirillales bacterium]
MPVSPPKPDYALPLDRAGVGFKPCYFGEVMTGDHPIGWFEIHAENYMIDGGPVRQQLEQLRARYPVSCHGVGLSIGSSEPLNRAHLARLKTLVDWLEPVVFSEHLAWSSHGGVFFNDLLPLPYTQATLQQVVDHIDEVQEALGRQMLLENPSTYVDFASHEMTEAEFITRIVQQTGCGLLLDINNVHVSSINQQLSPHDYLAALPITAVGEIHLAGHATDQDDEGEELLIDSHNAPVTDAVWALYDHVISHHGVRPTLVEWDGDLPAFDVLAREAAAAGQYLRAVPPGKGAIHVAE